MENQKVRDLSTATSPKATDFVMLITNLTNNVLEKCQLSELRTILTTNSISEDEGNALTTGSDDKLYVPDNTEEIDIVQTNVDNLQTEVNTISNEITGLDNRVTTLEQQSAGLIDKWEEGTEGYRIYADGWCEQWGHSAHSVQVTFLKKFKDVNYTALATYANTATRGNEGVPMIDQKKNTGFFMNLYYAAFAGADWMANGYLAEGEY